MIYSYNNRLIFTFHCIHKCPRIRSQSPSAWQWESNTKKRVYVSCDKHALLSTQNKCKYNAWRNVKSFIVINCVVFDNRWYVVESVKTHRKQNLLFIIVDIFNKQNNGVAMNVYKITYWYRVDRGLNIRYRNWRKPPRQVKHGDNDSKRQVTNEVR